LPNFSGNWLPMQDKNIFPWPKDRADHIHLKEHIMIQLNRSFIIPVIFIALSSCKPSVPAPTGLVTEKAMVVSARAEASKIGTDILRMGGNAFDAMVATELALAVAYPVAGNIGGGGFMVYRKADGEYGGLDCREKAPLSAHKNMYLDSLGEVIPEKSTLGA